MVKLLFLCRRRPDITHAAYVERLLGGHVPLALRHHPTLRRYVVNVVETVPSGAPELDSIGELWFDTLADFRDRLYDSPEGEATIRRDVATFMGAVEAYVTTELVQKAARPSGALGERSPGVKMICPLRRLTGMSHAAFVDHWLERHVPLALRHHPAMVGYVTNVVDACLSEAGEEWDGVAELTFASAEAVLDGLFDSAAGERVVREDIARFIGRTTAYWVAEYVEKR